MVCWIGTLNEFRSYTTRLYRWGRKKDSVSGNGHPRDEEVHEGKRFPGCGIRLHPSTTAGPNLFFRIRATRSKYEWLLVETNGWKKISKTALQGPESFQLPVIPWRVEAGILGKTAEHRVKGFVLKRKLWILIEIMDETLVKPWVQAQFLSVHAKTHHCWSFKVLGKMRLPTIHQIQNAVRFCQ